MTSNTKGSNITPDLQPLLVDITTLHPMPGKPRRGDTAAVARSYAQFGQRKPILARRSDRTVIAGNHQLAAATQLGWDQLAVVWVDDDDATAKAYALADNRTADLGDYDDDLLAALLADVQAAGDETLLAATGYDGDALEKLLRRVEFMAGDGDPDDFDPEPPAAPVTRAGDVWLLGPHRVLCGDSTLAGDYDTLLAGARADMVWTDPPYGVAYVGKTKDALTIQNDKLEREELRTFLGAVFAETWKHTRPGAVWHVTAPPGPLGAVTATLLDEATVLRGAIIWVKDRFVLGHSDYHYRHEPIYYGWSQGAQHISPPTRDQDSVWEIARPARSADHPTMKPVELVARAISNHTNDGDLVLDPFGGSGSTLIAANDLERRAALIELDPRYVDVICRRYQLHTGQEPVLERTGEPHAFA